MKLSVQELAQTPTTTDHNTATEATVWLKQLMERAKKLMFFEQVARKFVVPDGAIDIKVPYRTSWSTYTDHFSGWAQGTQVGEGTEVDFDAFDEMSTVTFTPVPHAYGVRLSYYSLKTNQQPLVERARESVMYYYIDQVDVAIRTALQAATSATNSASGAYDIYGGDASDTVDVEAGDAITTDMVAKAKRLLQSQFVWYWNSGTFTKVALATAKANTWHNTGATPFVMFIAPEQEETFLKDSQFINAAEYGGREAILNGEIGKYLGIKLVVANNVGAKSASDSGWNTDGHVCMLVVANEAIGAAWSEQPQLKILDHPQYLSKEIILYFAYQPKMVYNDAVCRINVADA